jgi:hypothetical protein
MDNIIALMMEAASISETSVNFYPTTRRNIPEDSHLYIFRRDNLKFHPISHKRDLPLFLHTAEK